MAFELKSRENNIPAKSSNARKIVGASIEIVYLLSLFAMTVKCENAILKCKEL